MEIILAFKDSKFLIFICLQIHFEIYAGYEKSLPELSINLPSKNSNQSFLS